MYVYGATVGNLDGRERVIRTTYLARQCGKYLRIEAVIHRPCPLCRKYFPARPNQLWCSKVCRRRFHSRQYRRKHGYPYR